MNSGVEIWLWILLVMTPYNPKSKEILDICGGDVEKAAKYIRDGECRILSDAERQRAQRIRSGDVRRVMEVCRENDIRIITLDDEEYPLRLRVIHNPPIVLFVKGSFEGLDSEVSIAVVGTRSPDKYSVNAGKMICGQLTAVGTVIVSGLAVGLDSAAHRACLDGGGRTIGVLACGMLVDYPVESHQLKEDILRSGGALVSELLPFTHTSASYFRYRNRIISGLCFGTLILEASMRSGCLLTAEHTIEQGRDLFCIPPHDITSARFSGVNSLLRDGAIPVFSYIDIVNQYLYTYIRSVDKFSLSPGIRLSDEDGKHKKSSAKKRPDPAPAEETPAALPDESVLAALEAEERTVLELIAGKPSDIESVLGATGMSHMDATSVLLNLELYGYIELGMDGFYRLAKK